MMDEFKFVLIAVYSVAILLGSIHAAISDLDPPPKACLCVDIDDTNVRDSACGNVFDITNIRTCYIYTGYSSNCILAGSTVRFFETNYTGQSGWILGNNLVRGYRTDCGFRDECAYFTCFFGGSCYNTANGAVCLCLPGREGPQCQFESTACRAIPCSNGGTCYPTEDGYECACRTGYTGAKCQFTSASLCIRTNSTDIEGGAITSPNFPNNYPDSVSCTAYIQPSGIRGITIEFLQPFDVKSSFDWLKVITSCPADTREIVYDNDRPPPKLLNLYSCTSATIEFKTDAAVSGAGFAIWYRSLCGPSYLLDNQGMLSSPNYPNSYSNNVDCVWYIVLKQYSTITLEFLSLFRLEENYDYVEVTQHQSSCQGLSSDVVTKYTGTTTPELVVLSPCRSITIQFHTDTSSVDSGFKIRYSVCGQRIFTENQGIISSPGYPANYPANVDCVWNIQFSQNRDITLDFVDTFSMGTNLDYVKIIQPKSSCQGIPADIEYYFFGTTHPESLTLSSCNAITIEFHSDYNAVGSGFKIQYTASNSLILRKYWEGYSSRVFQRSWIEYKQGFGDPTSLYWIGLDRLHETSQNGCGVRFDLQAQNGTWFFAEYSTFIVSDASDYYRLIVNEHSGDIFDSMVHHNNGQFSTENFGPEKSCAQLNLGGWWYRSYCCTACLTVYPDYLLRWVPLDGGAAVYLNATEVHFQC